MVGILSVLLFAAAAMTVDLGNAWSRKRDLQKQVDVSALAAGIKLPATAANRTVIAQAVAASINRDLNRVSGDQPGVTGSQLLDGATANGEVTFFDQPAAGADPVPCDPTARACPVMKVLAPPARVDFGMAGVMGFDGTDVQRSATVKVVSGLPPLQDTLPFWLPNGCGYGLAHADTTGSTSGPSPSASPSSTSATPSASASTSAPATATATAPPEPVGGHSLTSPLTPDAAGVRTYQVAQNGTITLSGLVINNVPSNTDRAEIRIYSPDFSRYIAYAAQDKQVITNPMNVPTFIVSAEVTSYPGTWHVYAYLKPSGLGQDATVNSNFKIDLRVTAAAPAPSSTPTVSATPSPTPTATATATSVPVGCVGQDRGNFGQLESPRRDESNLQKAFALNIAKGLDHWIVPFCSTAGNCPPDPQKDCGTATHPIPGGLPDFEPVDGKNCIKGDTGNDGPKTYDGLVGGVDGGPGRLDVSHGHTTCPNGRAVRSDIVMSGRTINNDVLSCYLKGSYTLGDIARPTGVTAAMLDQRVTDSPRFVWLPITFATDRAQKNYQPIVDFVPAFITDETQTSSATAANGLIMNGGGSSISTLELFVFNKDALDPDLQRDSVPYNAALRQAIVRLID